LQVNNRDKKDNFARVACQECSSRKVQKDMNKKLYPWLILFLCLTGASILLQAIIYSLIGTQLFGLDSFNIWFLTTIGTALIGSILLLTYYYGSKYWFVFVTYTLYCVCSLCYVIIFYAALNLHKPSNYFRPLLFLSAGIGIVYGASLIFLRAENKRWLKIAGALMVVNELILLFPLVWGVTQSWTAFTGCLVPVPFILHFSGEIRKGGTNNTDRPAWKYAGHIAGALATVSLSLTLISGIMISSESYFSLYWSNQNFQQTGELAKLCDPEIFVNSKGETLRYRLLKPLDYDSTKKYPIVISLPYGGQPPTDTIRQIEGAVAALLLATADNRKNYPAFLFIPNCPPGAGWGGIPNYPTVDSIVFDAIIALDRRFSIDEKRRYVIGLSRGGYGTWNFICKEPEMFAAAIPVAGGGDPTLAPKAVDVAVWAFHGAMDKNVPVGNSRNMINAIKAAGGNPKYTEYPDQGHNIWENVKATPGLLDWLFAQHRN
jgi:pimeloyl-ACP methyl ester carboxylesterase